MLLAVSAFDLSAQQQFYMYIQANASQPFYARIQNTIFSSSENGYVIIPRLHDSTYEVYMGFARNAFPEQHFSVAINRQDQGFDLKNFGEKGWGLQNLQTAAVIMNTGQPEKTASDNTGEKKNDAFSQMLANVVNDSAILYAAAKPVALKAPATRQEKPADSPVETKQDTVAAPIFTQAPPPLPPVSKEVVKQSPPDSILVAKTTIKDTVATPPADRPTATANQPVNTRPDPPAAKETVEKPFITRISENKTQQGYRAVYLEQYNFSTDTILVEIPAVNTATSTSVTVAPPGSQKALDTTVALAATPPPVATDTAGKKKQATVINSDCKNFASDSDLDKLRVKMLAENAVDDKLVVARKYFRTKCFSVRQVKALTELFPSDESRYRFFDTAYPFVSDTENFSSLDELIENDYYKTRFKAMIRR